MVNSKMHERMGAARGAVGKVSKWGTARNRQDSASNRYYHARGTGFAFCVEELHHIEQ